MSESELKTVESFFRSLQQPAITAAINVALRTGVLDALRQGQQTADSLARTCHLHPHALPALMQMLIDAEIVEQFGEHYALSRGAVMTPPSLWAGLFEQWTHLESALKSKRDSTASEFERVQEMEKRRARFLATRTQMQWTSTPAALKAAEALDIGDERRSLHILDLGCGAAIYSMTLAHRDPGCIVRLVDGERGLMQAQATVENLELEQRTSFIKSENLNIEGNDAAYDMVIIGDHIHSWTATERRQLLQTACRVLGPGGELVIIDVFASQARGASTVSQLQLQLLIGTGQPLLGVDDLHEEMKEAGLAQIQYTDLPAPPWTHGLLLGVRE